MRQKWLFGAALAAVAAVAAVIVVVAVAAGGDDEPASTEEYQAALVTVRDRIDFSLGRLSRAQSLAELLERMDEAAAAIRESASELDDETAPEGLESTHETIVTSMRTLATDIQGTADQARVPGFEDILSGAGLDFGGYDKINESFVKLRESGIEVPPLGRHGGT